MKAFTLALAAFVSSTVLADGMTSGWSYTLACPSFDQTGSSGTLTASATNFSCNGGCGTCQRQATNFFQKLTFTSPTLSGGVTLNATTLFALGVGKFLVVPPVISTDDNPIFAVASQCDDYTGTVNYLFIQIDPATFAAVSSSYMWGESTLSPSSTTLTNNFNIDGTQTWSGSDSLPMGSCSSGVWSFSGSSDFSAAMYTGNDWSGFYKTAPGRASLFLPQAAITQSYLGSVTYTGILYNSGTPSSVQNVRVTSNAAGSVFTVTPYSNVATNTLGANTYTITISAVNSPFNGGMKATVTYSGGGSTGKLACLANLSGGSDGQIVACSGQDPQNTANPITFFFGDKAAPGGINKYFGTNGASLTQVSTYTTPASSANGAAIDSSGKIVAVGLVAVDGSADGEFGVIRLNTDGSLDTTFNGTGMARIQMSTDATPSSRAQGVAIDPSGNIVVVGYGYDSSAHYEMMLARYKTDGSLDTTFNSTGTLVGNIGTLTACSGEAVAIDGSGKIVVAAACSDASGHGGFSVARYKTDGTLDTTFNSTGYNFAQLSTDSFPISNPYSVTIDGSGNIVLAGVANVNTADYEAAVARFTSAGALDTTFNSTGKEVMQFSAYSTPWSYGDGVAIDSSNRIVLVGWAYDSHGQKEVVVSRFKSTGGLDTTFNSTGKQVLQISTSSTQASQMWGAAIDSLGKIVAAGWGADASGNTAVVLARFNTNGTFDTTFNTTGKLLYQASAAATPSSSGLGLAIDSNGRIVTVGDFYDASSKETFGTLVVTP